MSQRNAVRVGSTEVDRNAFAVERYGQVKPESMKEMVDYLKNSGTHDYEVGEETIVGFGSFPILKVRMKGSMIEKIIDNEHDAQNTIANIRNKDFPKNKQGQ